MGVTTQNVKIRIEELDQYLIPEDAHEYDSGWIYEQVPQSLPSVEPTLPTSPDRRAEELDYTSLRFSGVGWGKVTSAPSGANPKAPYKETVIAGDEYYFVSASQFVDLLFYNTTTTDVIEISRLVDSAQQESTDEEADLWYPVIDSAIRDHVIRSSSLLEW